ncbi:NFYB/HAP3 family transcription factor subunit [Candidatus Woesearchaeota archaeon]|nr:NFYB/HAP3 family transcription factor subunit [Candidatus Woesearchaeota archaeon]
MVKIGLTTIDKCLRQHGAERISKKAKIALKNYLEGELHRIAKEAIGLAKKDKRKTILERDIEEAIKQKTLF